MATSAKQTAANQQNALKSTGPRTPEGKGVVAFNALKHGLLSKEVRLPDEDEAALVEFGKRLRSHLAPVGELEALLVDRIVASAWRLRRVMVMEVSVFEHGGTPYAHSENMTLGMTFLRSAVGSDAFSKLSRYETTIERGLFRALHELQRLQTVRAGDPVPPPAVVDVDVVGVSEEAA